MVLSIVISSYNRIDLFRRCLWSIANRKPAVPFEVVVVDDQSTDDVLGELRSFSSAFPWKFIRFDREAFESATGLRKFHNNPAVTNNIGVRNSRGRFIVQQGNEVIAWRDCYDSLLRHFGASSPREDGREVPFAAMSTTYDFPANSLGKLDKYGANLSEAMLREAWRWPLQSDHYRSDVTNYLSLTPRSLWDSLRGYDERYYGGIAAEDSDFIRRARRLPDFKVNVDSEAISIHQWHGGRTAYYKPPPNVISQRRWDEGVAVNRAIYDSWDGAHENKQKWDWGTVGAGEIISNG